MIWEEVGAIGQVLGSIAVFVTLGYLAVQVKHAKQQVQRTVSQSRAEAVRELMLNRVNNERLLGVTAKAHLELGSVRLQFADSLADRIGLTYEDGVALNLEQHAWWVYRAQVIAYVDELTAAERGTFDSNTRSTYEMPLYRLWYDSTKATLNVDAVRYVDNLLAQPATSPS